MKIAVYSGSFNPLHIGHLAIMQHLTKEDLFDCVYLIVSPQNPLKDSSNAKSGRERYEAAIEAVHRHPELKVKVDDIELLMEPPHYTIRTLDELRQREASNEFTLIIGADNLAIIRKWKDYQRILREYGVAVYPREGYDLNEIKLKLLSESEDYKIQILDAPRIDISSTEIRNGIAAGNDVSRFLM